MATVTCTYELADGIPDTGVVIMYPLVSATDLTPDPRVITQGAVSSELDDTGSVLFEVLASDDDGWWLSDGSGDPAPMPYRVIEKLGSRTAWSWTAFFMGDGPHDLSLLRQRAGLVPGVSPIPIPGYAPVVTVDSTTTGAPGSPAAVVDVDPGPDAALAFTIPQGVQGPQGEVAVDSTVTGAPGTDALVEDLDASAGRALLRFTIPEGEKGDKGDQGEVEVGTTTTGAPGSSASVVDTDLSPNRALLNFTIPEGDKGDKGDQGEVAVDSTVTGAAGTAAVVEDLDASPNRALLKFTVPQGVQGVQGEVSVNSTITGDAGTDALVEDLDPSPNRADLRFTVPQGTLVDVGTTTTGAPGSAAAVVDDDASPNHALLNFTIPQGVQGAPSDLTKAKADTLYESKSELLKEAAWYVDAGALGTGNDRLLDLTGRGRDAVFGAAAAAPVVLPWTGEDYVFIPGDTNTITVAGATNTATDIFELEWEGIVTDLGGASAFWAMQRHGMQIYINPQAQVYLAGPGGYTASNIGPSAATQLTLGQRHKIRATHDYNTHTTTLYLDGVSVGSAVKTGTPTYGNSGTVALSQGIAGRSQSRRVYRARALLNGVETHTLDPRNVSADYSTIANTGSAGGVWTITRAATGMKTAVVDRPLLLFGGTGQNATAEQQPTVKSGTFLFAMRRFTDSSPQRYWMGMEAPSTAGLSGMYGNTGAASSNVTAYCMVGTDVTTAVVLIIPVFGQCVIGQSLQGTTRLLVYKDGYLGATDNVINASAMMVQDKIRIGTNSTAQVSMEFISAAFWDRVLTDAEVAEVSLDLAGVPHDKQPDPHPQYVLESTVGNLLTENQASGTDTLGDTTGFVGSNATIARTAAVAANGTGAIRVTATAGTAGALVAQAVSVAYYVPVVPGQAYTGKAQMRADSVTKSALLKIDWRNDAGSSVGNLNSPSVPLSTSWREYQVTAVAPATATRAFIQTQLLSSTAGDVYDVDSFSFHKGAGGDWAMPGTPITGLQSSMEQVTLLADLPSVGNWLGRKIQVTSGLGYPANNGQIMMWNGTAWVVAPESDTGWQTITLANAWIQGTPGLLIRRLGPWVQYQGNIDKSAPATTDVAHAPAIGWRPDTSNGVVGLAEDLGSFVLVPCWVASTTSLSVRRASITGTVARLNVLYLTNNAWPTVAP